MKPIIESSPQIPYSESKLDTERPLSFQSWKKSQASSVLYEKEYDLYNEYLINWYQNKKNTNNDTLHTIRLNYLSLLKQIQIYFTREELENWYAGIDIDNEKELLLAIPYFSKKLKEIGLYYQHLRESIKKTKIRYNLVGTEKNAIQQIQEIFLSNFTKKPNNVITVPSTVWSNIPELSAITQTLNVEIEELYDNRTYFDRTPTLPPSAYFDTNNILTENFFTQKGLSLDNIDWIYRLGQFTFSSLYVSDSVSPETNELSGLFFKVGEQFLGSNRNSTFLIQSSAKKDFFTIDVNRGNNFFYWPSGTYKNAIKNNTRYTGIPINDSGLVDVATPGTSIEGADTIFVKTKNEIQGAWFYNKEFETQETVMEARINANDKTIFRFPFPGFGLSSEDITWTGYSLVSDPRYFYLDDKIKQDIEKVYWETSFELSGISLITLNETNLKDAGAYPNKNYELADKVRVWPTPPKFNAQSYTGPVNESWLYQFEKTDLPIASKSVSLLQWPLARIFNPNLPNITKIPEDICLPEKIGDINFEFSTASNNISSADKIYKVKNYTDTISQALECAWLSGSEYHYPSIKTKGINQNNFTGIFFPGTFTKFVWNSTNQIDVNRVFNGFQNHLPDCKYFNTSNATYEDYELCTCKHTYFAPFGHPGNTFNDYPGLADFIVEDTSFNENFDPTVWKDESGTLFAESSAVCWFKTKNKIGWGNGRWFSNSNAFANNFYLQQGKRYIYYRASIKNVNKEQKQIPEYVVRYKFPENESVKPVWVRGRLNDRKEWVSANEPSTMTFYPGDFLLYDRAPTTFFEVTGTELRDIDFQANPPFEGDNIEQGSIWSNYTFTTINSINPITVFYPGEQPYLPTTSLSQEFQKQIPKLFSTSIRQVKAWELISPNNTKVYYLNTPYFTFIPTLTGTYSIAVTALTGNSIDNEGVYYFTDIPKITAVNTLTRVPTVTAVDYLLPGFVLKTPLKGWDYSTGSRRATDLTFIPGNAGGAPYWANSYVNKTIENDFKGVEAWGGAARAVDTYNILTQPEFTNLSLSGGEYFEYQRNYPDSFVWSQPLELKTRVNKKEWCELKYERKNTLNYQTNVFDLITYPTTTPSTLLLQNYTENEPVEIYYNAIQSFTWNITATPEIEEIIFTTPITSTFLDSKVPWFNLFNQVNPTIALFPSFDRLSSTDEFGGYFVPQNLGILTYVNKDYSFETTLSSINKLEIFNPPTKSINTLGFTKQPTTPIFKIKQENNIWLKEPPTTGAQAGTIRNDIFKKYQKFIPYQSAQEVNNLSRTGLITPTSRQTPWGGEDDSVWTDTNNLPISFTGELNVNAWREDQILKINGLFLDNWATDIYGNQYGLYKDMRNLSAKQRINVGGEIWTRKNSQVVQAGTISLSSIYNQYKNISLYHELTSNNIKKIDTFFDTLFIETSSAILFEKIKYNFNTDIITSGVDSSRQISLVTPAINSLNREFNQLPTSQEYSKAGTPWFFPKEGLVYIPVVDLSTNFITPKIFCMDINKSVLTQVFPTNDNDKQSLTQLIGLNSTEISRPVLSYNKSKKHFVYSFVCKSNVSKHIVELHIENVLVLSLSDIKIYSAQSPEITPPRVINTNLTADVALENLFVRQILTDSPGSTFEEFNMPRWATISPSGVFFCQPRVVRDATRQQYDIMFKVTNPGGSAYYSILINVV